MKSPTKTQIRDVMRVFAKMGGKARAAKLTPEHRSAIAKKAAKARWTRKTA